MLQLGAAPEVKLERLGVPRLRTSEPIAIGRRHPNRQCRRHLRGDAILQRQEIFPVDVVVITPKRRFVGGAHELNADAQERAGRLQRAGQDVLRGKRFGRFARTHGLPLESEDRVGRANPHLTALELVDDRVRNADLEKLQIVSRGKAVKREYSDRRQLRVGRDTGRAGSSGLPQAGNPKGRHDPGARNPTGASDVESRVR